MIDQACCIAKIIDWSELVQGDNEDSTDLVVSNSLFPFFYSVSVSVISL